MRCVRQVDASLLREYGTDTASATQDAILQQREGLAV